METSAPNRNPTAEQTIRRLREQINAVDAALKRLLARRARLAGRIGRTKRRNGVAVYQPARELAVLERATADNPGPLSDEQLRRIFSEIISACRALEQPPRVAYLGPEHTYSHQAALRRFGRSSVFIAQSSIAEVFSAIEGGGADAGVVPVENSTEASVALTLDQLIDTQLVIAGELLLPIRHVLMSRDGDAARVRRLVSHQQSLAQCRNYIKAHFAGCETEAVVSNAVAALRAVEEPGCAAIGSEAAAEAYGLKVVAANIQDFAHNTTRFLVLGRREVPPTGRDKTTVLFTVPDQAGALNRVLAVLARNRVNVSKLESRPLRGRPWEYLFFADLAGHRQDTRLKRALGAMAARALFLKVLGSYPEARWTGG